MIMPKKVDRQALAQANGYKKDALIADTPGCLASWLSATLRYIEEKYVGKFYLSVPSHRQLGKKGKDFL